MAGILPDDVPGATQGGRRGAGFGVGLVLRIVGEMAAVLGVGARALGVPAPVVGGQIRAGRGLVAGVMLRGTRSRDVRREAAGRAVLGGLVVLGCPVVLSSPGVTGGRVVLGRPVVMECPVVLSSPGVTGGRVVLGGPVVIGRPVVPGSPAMTATGAGRGSGALGAAHGEADRQAGPPESGRPGRAEPGTARGPGKTVEHRGSAGQGHGHRGAGMVAGKAVAALDSVHLLRSVAAMAEPVARALGRRAAAGPGPGHGGRRGSATTIGTPGGHPAGSG